MILTKVLSNITKRLKASGAYRSFSLSDLLQTNPGLARAHLWSANPAPDAASSPWLHLGCGTNVMEGFWNLDIVPQDTRVTRWNVLDLWPEELTDRAEGLFSEDCFEHFYYAEQVYILCAINRALKQGGVARLLMPGLHRLVADYLAFEKGDRPDFLHQIYGVAAGGDILQFGMRFTGHRWLHDPQSISHMGAMCGFEAISTSCAASTVDRFAGLNLRDESDSASFGTDLRKTHTLARLELSPGSVKGARKVEEIGPDATLYVATARHPSVEYCLPARLYAKAVSCINVRGSNLSCSDWNLKRLVFDELNMAAPWGFDETLKSQSCMNVITNGQIRSSIGSEAAFSKLTFSPAASIGEYFVVGNAEIFH